MEFEVLPLFPLPVVLFPGTMIPLHIFEPRYRQMVTDALESGGRFGLLYHDPDESGPFLNEGGTIGTVAEIRKHQPLPDGRSLILVRGMGRFRILEEVAEGSPYYQAKVVEYKDTAPSDPSILKERRARSLALFKKVVQGAPQLPEALPTFTTDREISFKLAASARMDPAMQQEILELRQEEERLARLDPIFRFGLGQLPGPGRVEA